MNYGSVFNDKDPIEDILYDKRTVGKYVFWVVYFSRKSNAYPEAS